MVAAATHAELCRQLPDVVIDFVGDGGKSCRQSCSAGDGRRRPRRYRGAAWLMN